MHHSSLELGQHVDLFEVLLGLHTHALGCRHLGRVVRLLMQEIIWQLQVLRNSFGILRFLFLYVLLDMFRVERLQEITLQLKTVIEVYQV